MNSQMTLLALGGKCGLPSGGRPVGHRIGPHDPVAGEHRPQRQPGEAHAQVGEEGPAMNAAARTTAIAA